MGLHIHTCCFLSPPLSFLSFITERPWSALCAPIYPPPLLLRIHVFSPCRQRERIIIIVIANRRAHRRRFQATAHQHPNGIRFKRSINRIWRRPRPMLLLRVRIIRCFVAKAAIVTMPHPLHRQQQAKIQSILQDAKKDLANHHRRDKHLQPTRSQACWLHLALSHPPM